MVEVKWTREKEQSKGLKSPQPHIPPAHPTTLHPNLASLQPNLVKILPWLMPSRERGGRAEGGTRRITGVSERGHETKV